MLIYPNLGADSVTGDGVHERCGAQAISLISTPLGSLIVKSLAAGPKPHGALLQDVGAPAQTTLRSMLKQLSSVTVVERRRRNDFPRGLEYALTTAGDDLLVVATTAECWLGRAPGGAMALGSNAARAAMKALKDGWSSTMLRAMATGPLSLKQLDRVIGSLTYPSLERRLAALRLTEQIEARARDGRSTPYTMTAWGREGIGPLAAAARWERVHLPGAAPVRRLDAEAMFLLSAPLLRTPADLAGSCRLAVELSGNNGRRLAGVMLAVESGRVTSCSSRLQSEADAWALGSPTDWLEAIAGAERCEIESGGDRALARALLGALREALFHPPRVRGA